MHNSPAPVPTSSSALSTLGKRAVAWIVVAAVAVLALKLVVGVVMGLVTMVFTIVLVVIAIAGVLWALRHL
jgi:hypothetical protein